MNLYGEYTKKLKSADEAVKIVKSGDWVDYGSNNAFPMALDAALGRRRDELHGVKLRGNFTPGPIAAVECDPEGEHFIYNTWHCSGYERKLLDRGRGYFTPMVFRNLAWYYREFLTVDVAMVSVAPMDENGRFNLGGALGASKAAVEKAKYVIVEINPQIPYICGGEETSVALCEVDAIVETEGHALYEMPNPAVSETDRAIAQHIFPYLCSGATIQLGIGGMPNALGSLIADSDLQDLAMHTELASDGYLDMYRAGKLTNRRKTVKPGVGVLGLAIGSRAFYDWLDHNPEIEGKDLSWVNDPSVLGQIDNLISINGCLSADLYGQVCSESVGTRQISGTGGQLDFVLGATVSRGGRSFLCMSSTFTDKHGERHSRIVPTLSGDIVTTPRSEAYYVATEYGVANLAGKSTWERAEALVSLAHPDFRAELIRAAEQQKIWLPSNRR